MFSQLDRKVCIVFFFFSLTACLTARFIAGFYQRCLTAQKVVINNISVVQIELVQKMPVRDCHHSKLFGLEIYIVTLLG